MEIYGFNGFHCRGNRDRLRASCPQHYLAKGISCTARDSATRNHWRLSAIPAGGPFRRHPKSCGGARSVFLQSSRMPKDLMLIHEPRLNP